MQSRVWNVIVLWQIIEQYKPTLHELRSMFRQNLKLKWGRVKGNFPDEDHRNDMRVGTEYRTAFDGMCERLRNTKQLTYNTLN